MMRCTRWRYAVERRKVSWIVEVDIREYFDRIDREQLLQFLEMRIGDRRYRCAGFHVALSS